MSTAAPPSGSQIGDVADQEAGAGRPAECASNPHRSAEDERRDDRGGQVDMTRRADKLQEYPERLNELLGTSPAATGSGHADPNFDPNSVLDPHGHV